jgi:hypothetical protein
MDKPFCIYSPQIIYNVRELNIPLSRERGAHIGKATKLIFLG